MTDKTCEHPYKITHGVIRADFSVTWCPTCGCVKFPGEVWRAPALSYDPARIISYKDRAPIG